MNFMKPLDARQAAHQLDAYFQKIQTRANGKPLQIQVYSEKLGLDYSFPSDSTNQPYHIASIGKVFTAVLAQRLAEKGAFSTKDAIHTFFTPAELEMLFVYKNIDYAEQVTIDHLLGHTSGIADYFEGKANGAQPFTDQILSTPHFHWTPQALLDYTREHQAAVGSPGKRFNYSDSGYILLGRIIEKVTGKSFEQNLEDEIFQPLGMRDSYLMFYSQPLNTPKKPIEKIWFNGVEISGYESLSCDWSGGGIVSTTADLLKFNQALRCGRLVPSAARDAMDACGHKFRPGIYYGLGMMEIRFKEFFFLLGHLPRIKGHIGILGTHMFFDHTTDAHILMNFGDNTRMVESFQALIGIENTLQRIV